MGGPESPVGPVGPRGPRGPRGPGGLRGPGGRIKDYMWIGYLWIHENIWWPAWFICFDLIEVPSCHNSDLLEI